MCVLQFEKGLVSAVQVALAREGVGRDIVGGVIALGEILLANSIIALFCFISPLAPPALLSVRACSA